MSSPTTARHGIWAGEIGNVTEVHAWTDRPIWPQGLTEVPPPDAVPSTLDWDTWLGIAPSRPYTSGGSTYAEKSAKFYQPFNWRGFYDFGCGALGDMACHTANMAFKACKLGYPTSVEAEVSELNPETYPLWSVVRYEFPERDGGLPHHDPLETRKADCESEPSLPTSGLEVEEGGFLRPSPNPRA